MDIEEKATADLYRCIARLIIDSAKQVIAAQTPLARAALLDELTDGYCRCCWNNRPCYCQMDD